MTDKRELLSLLEEKEKRVKYNRLRYYKPYPWQIKFHNLSKEHPQRLLMAGNRTGKTFGGASDTAFHVTGLYPDWWDGYRFEGPETHWVAGASTTTTRDVVQSELFGRYDDPTLLGTGTIPRDCIVDTIRRPGVPFAFDSVLVKHVSGGNSRVVFKSYEMDIDKWMGSSVGSVWLDEEPSQALFSQAITRTANTGGLVTMTFTPEAGMTQVVHNFMNDIKPGQALIQATWEDAPHLTEKVKEQLLGAYSPHEREMRRKGIPVFGSGLVYPISQDNISCPRMEIPRHFRKIAGIDFGWNHPTAVIWLAHDADTDIVYLYDAYAQDKQLPPMHAAAINAHGYDIPVAWPHDGYQEKGAGVPIAEQYREQGVNMLHKNTTHAPALGQEEGKGGIAVEPGITELLQRMETGRFKVFEDLNEWFLEFSQYHRKDGVIYKEHDDLMDATRYALMSLRHAVACGTGSSNGNYVTSTSQIKYDDRGIV